MRFNSSFQLDVGDLSEMFFTLLQEEDFNFKTKNIDVSISKLENLIEIVVSSTSVLDLKIGTTAVIKSLEIIDKVIKNG